MSDLTNQMYRFVKRPDGLPSDGCFEWVEAPVPALEDGQFLLKNLYISLDPSIRTQMTPGPNYLPPIELGQVMRGVTLGEVMASKNPDYAEGDLVFGMHGWERYTVSEGGPFSGVVPRVEGVPLTAYMGVIGPVGQTAYFGLLEVGQPKAGDTVLVSGAAGSVGSVVGQIAKLKGCTVVGLAGSDEKCAWLTGDCGFDAAINYRTHSQDLPDAMARACPDGVDVYFDNVGGATLDAALMNINDYARVVCCGTISGYNDDNPSPPVHNLWMVIIKSVRMQGFLISDYVERFPEASQALAGWMSEGKIAYREDVMQGLENAPEALRKLFTGGNQGKMIVALAQD